MHEYMSILSPLAKTKTHTYHTVLDGKPANR